MCQELCHLRGKASVTQVSLESPSCQLKPGETAVEPVGVGLSQEVVVPATSEQPGSNLVTVPPSVHGCHFAAGGCSDVKESWIQLQER
ncbi:hypothetical protein E2C01_033045 [Portunus trituberculatus]|uniref:Uncharacterized protein n=1 Tax=Portunus trituberculatus TaxID=210409 RepID=A0A5B7F2X5_PORTR|nr:hypothetical protein [Portunus trituberculatus]